jgi:sterol desaturase/sphingolipid hydroxylase (fatty acid hydroxylase superfamily)
MSAAEVDVALGIAVFFQFFIHSNLLWKCRPLELIFVFPQFHRIHHVRPELEEEPVKHGVPCDLNYSSVFSFWDRWFKTAYEPATWEKDTYPVGLRPEEKAKTRLRDFMIGF